MNVNKRSGISRGSILPVIILVILAIIAVLSYFASSKVLARETYYVLNVDVPVKGIITEEMLDPIETSEGTAPPNALTIADIQEHTIQAQIPLMAGDIITASNVGGVQDIRAGIPDDWVVTTLAVGADDAAGGRIRRGSYFDIMTITTNANGENVAKYAFVNVLALDTTVSLAGASSSEAAYTDEAHNGQTQQYVVAMKPSDAAKLHLLKANGATLKLVMSPNQNRYAKPKMEDYQGEFTLSDNPVWPGESSNGEVTDSTFTRVERDPEGRPVAVPSYCTKNNDKITGDECQNLGKSKNQIAQEQEAKGEEPQS